MNEITYPTLSGVKIPYENFKTSSESGNTYVDTPHVYQNKPKVSLTPFFPHDLVRRCISEFTFCAPHVFLT